MKPLHKALLQDFGRGAALSGLNFGTAVVGSIIGVVAAELYTSWETRRDEKRKQRLDQKVLELTEGTPSFKKVFPPDEYPHLYNHFEDRVAGVVVEAKEPTVLTAEKLEDLGPFWGHDIFIHEDTQPPGKTKGDGCSFHIWEWKTEIEDREFRRDHGPYHLNANEFEENEYQFQQRYCTYYVDTNTLVDEDGVEYPWSPNNGFEGVGDLRSVEWGRGARQSNAIYLRNEFIEEEYMIVREGSPPHEMQLAFGERDGDDLHDLEGHKDPKGL